MKQKISSTSFIGKQMDFFSIFDFEEEENEIIPIVESPLEYINNAIAQKQSMQSEEKHSGPELVPHVSDDVALLGHCSKLLNNQILHGISFASETDYLFTLEEYNAELGGLVIDWAPEDVYQLYVVAMEESLENVKYLVFTKSLYTTDEFGNIKVNPLLEAETRWYMSQSFELTCATHGIDAIEFRSELKKACMNTRTVLKVKMLNYLNIIRIKRLFCMIVRKIWDGISFSTVTIYWQKINWQ
ncbi:hypothetical protein ACKUTQ_30190 [Klebsiella michiganensis]